ncbi:MAG: GSU2086 family protein, partial [Planctomycetota bacterium]
ADFPKPVADDASLRKFLDALPDFLGVKDMRALSSAVARSHKAGRGVIAAMGGHVVKTGCSPQIVDLMERGIVTGVVLAGSTAIHDWEIARVGHTSEDVAAGLQEGEYGMAEETGAAFAAASADAVERGIGLGRALGEAMEKKRFRHRRVSLLATAARLDLPATVHLAMGTDITHMHPDADGASMGEATFTDFRTACTVVAGLSGGVWLNLGSAVVLPEVFLKAITVSRNTGKPVSNLTTGSFDMYRMYRPLTNVVQRPPKKGYSVIGHHEILIPLFRAMILRELKRRKR